MYEELITALRTCVDKNKDCLECPYYERCMNNTSSKLIVMVDATDAIEELSKPQNTVHLCTSCKYQYPECPADTGVVFGRGKGNDNICQCADYVARIPHWIPVTERFPEDNEMVLCFTPVDGYMCVGYHYSYKWGSNTVSKWRIITAMRSTKDITKKVTHWMPLPEPPKEEE